MKACCKQVPRRLFYVLIVSTGHAACARRGNDCHQARAKIPTSNVVQHAKRVFRSRDHLKSHLLFSPDRFAFSISKINDQNEMQQLHVSIFDLFRLFTRHDERRASFLPRYGRTVIEMFNEARHIVPIIASFSNQRLKSGRNSTHCGHARDIRRLDDGSGCHGLPVTSIIVLNSRRRTTGITKLNLHRLK